MKKFTFILLLIVLTMVSASSLYAQVGIGTTSPNGSSILDLVSTNKGFLMPRMGAAPASPPEGLMYLNSSTAPLRLYYYSDGSWRTFAFDNHTHPQLHDRSHLMTSTADHTATAWQLFYSNNNGNIVELPMGTLGQVLKSNGTNLAPSWQADNSSGGTVTSVGLALPAQFTVSSSPVTSSGTLTGSWATQATNLVFSSPNGSTGVPTFRALVDNDIPNTITASNYLPLAGGTMTGDLNTVASTTTASGLTLPHGTAPTTPTNGDLWTTTAGLYARINGTTVGPMTANTGTVTSIATNNGITGGTITGTGTLGLTGQALAVHNLGTNGLITRTASGTVAARSVAVSGNAIAVANGDGVSGNPTLSLSIGTGSTQVAAGNHTHTNMVDGTGAANKVAYWSDANTLSYNTNFHWDNTNGRLGIGTTNPVGRLVANTSQSLSMTLQDWGQDERGLYREGLTVRTPNRGALIHLTTDYTPGGNEIYSEFNFQRSRSGLTSVQQNDHIGSISFGSFMSSYWYPGPYGMAEYTNSYMMTAAINCQIEGVVSAGNSSTQGSVPTCLTFCTTSQPSDYFYPQIVPERMRITNTGNVGIGTTAPDQKFVVYNGSTTGRYTTSGWTHTSDARLKKNIKPLESSLENVLKMQGVRFDFTSQESDNSGQIGFIAQEIEKIYPEVVVTGEDGYKSVAYSQVIPVLVEAIKEMHKEIDALKAENTSLKAEASRITALEQQMNATMELLRDSGLAKK